MIPYLITDGLIRTVCIGSSVPSGAFYNGGLAYHPDGSLYIHAGDVPDSAVDIGGMKVTHDGAVCVVSGVSPVYRVGGLPVDDSGRLVVKQRGVVSVRTSAIPLTADGVVAIEDRTPLYVGEPAAWFRYGLGITKDGSNLVSQWDDQSGNGRHLKQATEANKPTWQSDGSILFDGVDNFMACDAFTLNLPVSIYLLMKQVTWTDTDRICDGNASGTFGIRQRTTSPLIQLVGATGAANNTNLAVDTYGVVFASAADASTGVLQINNTTATTGDPQASNMGGFYLGSAGGGAANFSNIQVKEVILYAAAHDADTRAAVISQLMVVGGL